MSLLSGAATAAKPGHLFSFNNTDGYCEGLLRGFKKSFLTDAEYAQLTRAETLDDIKMNLAETDYGPLFADEPSPLRPNRISEKAEEKWVNEFKYVRTQAVEPLATFMDFITYEFMIESVMTLLKGTQNPGVDMNSLIEKCHPLGKFKDSTMRAIGGFEATASGFKDLYQMVLVDTPVGIYFQQFLQEQEEKAIGSEAVSGMLAELPIQILENSILKLYLQDFHSFCMGLGGETAEIMNILLGTRADFISISMVYNTLSASNEPVLSLNTKQAEDERRAMFPSFGFLYPFATGNKNPGTLSVAHTESDLKAALEPFPQYLSLFKDVDEIESGSGGGKKIEDQMYARQVRLYELAFMGQFHYGIFYAYAKLKQQEVRNLAWIAECVMQRMKHKIDKIIPIFGRDIFKWN